MKNKDILDELNKDYNEDWVSEHIKIAEDLVAEWRKVRTNSKLLQSFYQELIDILINIIKKPDHRVHFRDSETSYPLIDILSFIYALHVGKRSIRISITFSDGNKEEYTLKPGVGQPRAPAKNRYFIEKGRTNRSSIVEDIWILAEKAVSYKSLSDLEKDRDTFIKLFEKILGLYGVRVPKLTQALFLLNPVVFCPYDGNTKKFRYKCNLIPKERDIEKNPSLYITNYLRFIHNIDFEKLEAGGIKFIRKPKFKTVWFSGFIWRFAHKKGKDGKKHGITEIDTKKKLYMLREHIKKILEGVLKDEVSNREEIVKSAIAHLVSGKNVVFYGAPGTGKTRLAKKICEGICGEENFIIETANSEWTHFDVVGGYQLEEAGKSTWIDGFLTRAAKKCIDKLKKDGKPYWLIIDELNRANLDLAFGEVFTLLDIEYRKSQPLYVKRSGEGERIHIPYSFRIIATMNTYDRTLLFSLGYAFMRRFAFVHTPSIIKVSEIFDYSTRDTSKIEFKKVDDKIKSVVIDAVIKQLCLCDKVNNDYVTIFQEICSICEKGEIRKIVDDLLEHKIKVKDQDLDFMDILLWFAQTVTKQGIEIGQALVIDAAKFIVLYQILFGDSTNIIKIIDEAIMSYILPQLEYYMPQLRKGEFLGEKEVKEKWRKIIELSEALGLNKTKRTIENAERSFRIIY